MELRKWRQKQGLTLLEIAEKLGIKGSSPASLATTVSRIERGVHAVDALIADKIVLITGGEVSINDIHTVRRNYMLANRSASNGDDAVQQPVEVTGQ